jgi:hypothetical protein
MHSVVRITRVAAMAMSMSMNWRPSIWAFPYGSQRCTWIRTTSGLSAGSSASSSPVKGQGMVRSWLATRLATSEPSIEREGMKGSPMAPAR